MPTSDLDMPLLPSAEQIRRREFATVRRGYDPQQVRAYLTSIANQVGMLERELSELRLAAGSAAARGDHEPAAPTPEREQAAAGPVDDPYDALSKRFAHLIEMADQEADRILENARSEAQSAVERARSDADRIRVDAQARAEEAKQEGSELLEHAKIESDRILSALVDKRRALVSQLDEMRSTLVTVADELTVSIDDAHSVDAEESEADPPTTTVPVPSEGEDAAPAVDAPVDPRYEDLWVNTDSAIELPDLASIDLDFDEREE
ncbi:MAG TPA: DivIVA domain-containing protein [Actinomycetota bacterium]|nr:DivIVA domain-containing protein [Actinomycetota bacterium]